MAVEAPVAEPQVAVEPTPVSAEPQVKQPPIEFQETPPTCTLNIQVGEWLTLRLKTPVPESMRIWVNNSLATAEAFMEIDTGALPETEQRLTPTDAQILKLLDEISDD